MSTRIGKGPSVKIDSTSKPLGSTATPGGSTRARASGGATSAGNTGGSTEATLSGLQGLSNVLASSPVVDTERVAEIKRAIAEGRFQVNPERIADGLLKSVQDMLAGSR